jgi:membrane-bound ClpP family serine protease
VPNWTELLREIQLTGGTHDVVRRKYLAKLQKLTGRNIIAYYSGWLQKPGVRGIEVNDADKNGFMNVVHGLDRSKGLDLLLHTPGGDTAATESLVDYLRAMFGTNIRAIVPQIALSAGTMIACACKEIVMGKQSSLGPIDPQIGGIPAHGIVEEFKRAITAAQATPHQIPIWQAVVAKYSPAFVVECEHAIAMTNGMATSWLQTGMFASDPKAQQAVPRIVSELGDHAISKSHGRHLSIDYCQNLGLKIVKLEDDQKLQDAVLTVHHSMIHTLGATAAFKIIENHEGQAFIQISQAVAVTA